MGAKVCLRGAAQETRLGSEGWKDSIYRHQIGSLEKLFSRESILEQAKKQEMNVYVELAITH